MFTSLSSLKKEVKKTSTGVEKKEVERQNTKLVAIGNRYVEPRELKKLKEWRVAPVLWKCHKNTIFIGVGL